MRDRQVFPPGPHYTVSNDVSWAAVMDLLVRELTS